MHTSNVVIPHNCSTGTTVVATVCIGAACSGLMRLHFNFNFAI